MCRTEPEGAPISAARVVQAPGNPSWERRALPRHECRLPSWCSAIPAGAPATTGDQRDVTPSLPGYLDASRRERPGPRLWVFPLALAVLALLLALLVAPAVRADSPVDEIAGQLACQCGCGLTALACGGAMQCDVGDQMVALISQKVKNGETKDQVLSYFVTQYGEKVLAAPTKKGFNLTAWVTPFLAVGAGGTAVYFVLREWIGNRRLRQESETPAGVDLGSYGERIDRELEQFG